MKTKTNHLKKKFFVGLIISLSLFVNTKPSHALFGIGDVVIDPTNIVQTTITAIATPVSAATDVLNKINTWILGPIADAMRIAQMVKSGNYIRNLVLGSMGTNNALLITNPKQYLENQAKASVRESLNTLDMSTGLYSSEVSGDTIRLSRLKNDSKARLEAATYSDKPNLIQRNLCDDEELTKITEFAGEDEPQDPDTYNTREEELYDKLCSGDPAEDPELANVLLELNVLNPSVGGWDTIRYAAATGGANAAKMRASMEIAASEQAKVAAKQMDLTLGKGIRSETECGPGNVNLQEDSNGYSWCPEGKETITKLATQLDQSLKEAIGSPLKLLSDSYGSKGIFALVGSIASLVSTFNTVSGGFSATVSSGSEPTTTVVGGKTVTTYATSSYTHTLTPGTGQAKVLSDNIKEQMKSHLTDLSKLRTIDSEFLTSVENFEEVLNQGKSCYDGLVDKFPFETIRGIDFPSLSGDSRVQAGLTFFNQETAANTRLKNSITTEIDGIETTGSLIEETSSKVASSDSIEEIQDLFTNYTSRVDKEGLPGMTAAMQRVSDSNKFDIKVKEMTETGTPKGKIIVLYDECVQIDSAETARREDARSSN